MRRRKQRKGGRELLDFSPELVSFSFLLPNRIFLFSSDFFFFLHHICHGRLRSTLSDPRAKPPSSSLLQRPPLLLALAQAASIARLSSEDDALKLKVEEHDRSFVELSKKAAPEGHWLWERRRGGEDGGRWLWSCVCLLLSLSPILIFRGIASLHLLRTVESTDLSVLLPSRAYRRATGRPRLSSPTTLPPPSNPSRESFSTSSSPSSTELIRQPCVLRP